MYKVLIVDDEALIREGIAATIQSGCPRFGPIYEASDGDEALNLAHEISPDLVITDIQMPRRDGIDLIEQLKADNPDLSVIIISGFDDFEYARKGLKMAVNDYWLKPVDSAQLRARLNQLADELDERESFRKDQSELRRLVKESLPLYRERLFRQLIESGKAWADRSRRARELGIPMDCRYYGVAVVRFELEDVPPQDELLFEAWVDEIVSGTASRYAAEMEVHYFFAADQEMVLLIGSRQTSKERCFLDINQWLTRLGKALQNHVNPECLHIAVGTVCASVRELPQAYQQAKEALLFRLSVKDRMILNFEELAAAAPEAGIDGNAEEIALQVKLMDANRAREAVRAYMAHVTSAAGTHPHWVKLSLLELSMSLLKALGDAHLGLNTFFRHPEIDPYTNVYRLDSEAELTEWLERFVDRCIDELARSKVNRSVSHVEKVKQYVESRYGDSSLSLSEVAANLFLSPHYLRQLFRQETGVSFVEYVSQFRMERALLLLKDPTLKIQDIAEKVGFEEQRYFSSCFKKYCQMTPTEYREAIQQGLV